MAESLAERLAALPAAERDAALASLTDEQARLLVNEWEFWARPDQLAPPGDWSIWLILAGRGWGKTRTGAETVRQWVCGLTPLARGYYQRVALVAETAADARDVMVEGDSGLLAIHPADFRPVYEPSKRRVTWPNGAMATLYNATEPDQLRGPQHDCAWLDELAKWRYAQETWDQLQFGLRSGAHPRQVITTTPRPIALLRDIMGRAETVVTRGRTMDNRANLAETFVRQIVDRYAGTRLGRQELDAEMLDDVPGALWTRRALDEHRVKTAPPLQRIVVGVDPAATSGEDADETGIVVAGVAPTPDGHAHGYVLDDWSLRGTPEEWARKAVAAYRAYEADRIIAEANQGGEMVASVIRTVSPTVPVTLVHASRGKYVRAEPISALYEQGRVHHVGALPALEDQMISFTPDADRKYGSPDRVDALVWAMTELFPQMTQRVAKPKSQRPAVHAGAGGWMG